MMWSIRQCKLLIVNEIIRNSRCFMISPGISLRHIFASEKWRNKFFTCAWHVHCSNSRLTQHNWKHQVSVIYVVPDSTHKNAIAALGMCLELALKILLPLYATISLLRLKICLCCCCCCFRFQFKDKWVESNNIDNSSNKSRKTLKWVREKWEINIRNH